MRGATLATTWFLLALAASAAEPARHTFNFQKVESTDAARCSDENVFCIFEDGQLLEWPTSFENVNPNSETIRESPSITLSSGDTLRVLVFGCPGSTPGELAIELAIASTTTSELAIGKSASPSRSETGNTAAVEAKRCESGFSGTYTLLNSVDVESSLVSVGRSFRVVYKPVAGSPIGFTVGVRSERFYIDIGLMLPAVWNGDRRIAVVQSVMQNQGSTLHVREGLGLLPTPTMHVFPLGLRKGAVSFVSDICWFDETERRCGWRRLRDIFAPIGLHVGIDGDLGLETGLRGRLLGGLSVAPMNGIVLTGGLAFMTLPFLPEGYQSGMVVQNGFSLRPEDVREMVVVRPYLGISLNYELFATFTRDGDG